MVARWLANWTFSKKVQFLLLSLFAWTLSGERNKIIKFTASFSLNRRFLEMEDVRELEVFSCCVITFFFDSV